MNKIYTTTKEMDELYEGSALTWEGLDISDENLQAVIDWIRECGTDVFSDTFYITSGKDMNAYCGGLKGRNAYSNDLSIVSIKLSNIKKVENIVVRRFEVGGRWFDDIVDNNRRR